MAPPEPRVRAVSLRTLRGVRALLFVLVLALACAGAASASHLDPQKRIVAADQKRADAMLLRKADLLSGYEPEQTSGLEPHLTCRPLDGSDLVLTGSGRSPYWAREYQIVGSSSAVYRTAAEARTAWRRGASAPGLNCLRDAFRNEFARQGETVRVSIRRIAVPRFAVASQGFRIAISGPTGRPPLAHIDVVRLLHRRALAELVFVGVVAPPARGTETALAQVVARRMKAAMRGSA